METKGESAMHITARQRKHCYMHSSIFDAEGPTTKSVYAPCTQHELLKKMSPELGDTQPRGGNGDRDPRRPRTAPANNPDLALPSAQDMKITQNAGCRGAVYPDQGEQAAGGYPAARTSSRNVLVHDGETKKVVRAVEKNHEAIPKEFWATSVGLQWHDPRNELGRDKTHAGGASTDARERMNAGQRKRQELSSEVFGTHRRTAPSTAHPKQELQADTADHLLTDSVFQCGPDQLIGNTAAERMSRNLANTGQRVSQPVMQDKEDQQTEERRRHEKNFSDLFGTEMGHRKEVRGNREEIIGTRTCSIFDTKTEIAARNQAHWQQGEQVAASGRKDAERDSQLFGFSCPERPGTEPETARVLQAERACWESGLMDTRSEIARRNRGNEAGQDFGEHNATTHMALKQESLSSTQLQRGMGAEVDERPRFIPNHQSQSKGPTPSEREMLLKSAKETKLASLQSSIFS